jgi:hypothetical protein
MYELVYSSKAIKSLKEDDVSSILETSRDFNSKNNITGCLVFHNDEFIQILEGEEEQINELFANIEKDKRHKNVFLIYKAEKNERMFKNWSMAYYKLDKNDMDNIQRKLFIENFIAYSEITNSSTNAVKLFWYISKNLMREF